MSHYVDFNACFFRGDFQPMNAAVTFQIGLNESARAIRGKFTFAGAWESCCRMRTEVTQLLSETLFITTIYTYLLKQVV